MSIEKTGVILGGMDSYVSYFIENSNIFWEEIIDLNL
jgi:hypothetical protein